MAALLRAVLFLLFLLTAQSLDGRWAVDRGRFVTCGNTMYFIFIPFTDTKVTCRLGQRCVLPCTFRGDDPVIHWLRADRQGRVLSYYYGAVQRDDTYDDWYKGRTSLFSKQILVGNASLEISGTKPQDEGRYQCYTGTHEGIKDSFISLTVYRGT